MLRLADNKIAMRILENNLNIVRYMSNISTKKYDFSLHVMFLSMTIYCLLNVFKVE